MGQSEEAREVHPWGLTFRNTDNPTGPDYRPQFVSQDMPYAEDMEPDIKADLEGDLVDEDDNKEGAGEQDPKGSTVTESAGSSKPTESSPKGAKSASVEKAAPAATVEPGAKTPEN